VGQKIILVDDEENILAAYSRILRKTFEVEIALGGTIALEMLETDDSVAVVVSDMRMPGMDGVEFLSQVKNRWPDVVRIMLTGNADQETAMKAVNRGAIFRFLTKPCDPENLTLVLDAALKQHRLVTAEKALLERTLRGAIGMLVELLGVMDPVCFGRARTISDLAEHTARHLGIEDRWVLGTAAVLSQIGILTLPPEVVEKIRSGAFLNSEEREMANQIPETGAALIRHVPRMEEVAKTIYYLNKNFNGSGFPADDVKGENIPILSRVLRAANDYVTQKSGQRDSQAILRDMESRTAWYDFAVIKALRLTLGEVNVHESEPEIASLLLRELRMGMTLLEGASTYEGLLVLPAGTVLGLAHLHILRNFWRLGQLKEPLQVRVV